MKALHFACKMQTQFIFESTVLRKIAVGYGGKDFVSQNPYTHAPVGGMRLCRNK